MVGLQHVRPVGDVDAVRRGGQRGEKQQDEEGNDDSHGGPPQ
jgi:hypothetical protein